MPILTDLDRFRLELGDRNEDAPLFNDDEAGYFLDKNPGNVLAAVADACDALSRTFANKADTEIKSGDDSVKRKYSGMAETWATRASEMRKRAIANSGIPWHGGGSFSRKCDLAQDTDRVQPRFRRGQFNAPGTEVA